MKTITVTVIHPTDGREIRADVDRSVVINQLFDALVENGFVERLPYSGYYGVLLPNATCTRSDWGNRWWERIWSVLATCEQQRKNVMEFLKMSIGALLQGRSAPTLLKIP